MKSGRSTGKVTVGDPLERKVVDDDLCLSRREASLQVREAVNLECDVDSTLREEVRVLAGR